MSNSIRIRTTPNGSDKYVKVKLDQEFDFIEILSLKISQDKAYQKFCSDYGVIAGRVSINNGFGIENAKVSVFIPISEEDSENLIIKGLYPFEVISDKDSEGIRYNLLPKESDSEDPCYTPVGTFASKREIIDNDTMLEVYNKYYKFTTTTNHAGDFMIFGVPLGTHTVHVDADISNIGIASQRPFDLIDQGVSSKMFYSPTKFKGSKNLDTLVQIKTSNVGVNVQPFWGDVENCEVGISRVDIDLNYSIRPAAIFMGSIFGDNHKNSVNKNCRPRKQMGKICETMAGPGSIDMIRKTVDGEIEDFSIDGGRVIDDDGTWAYQIPMNLDYMITDEFGNLILSEDSSRGVPTRARVRFRIGMDEAGGIGRVRTRAKYLVPHNPTTFADRDFNFDKTTKDSSFTDLYWNKIYTVKNFIARVQNGGGVDRRAMLGMKDLDKCTGDKTPFPYNKIDTNFSPLFSIICILLTIIAGIVYLLNVILCAIRDVKFLGIQPFKNLVKPIPLKCPSDPPMEFTPGCNGGKTEPFIDCVSAVIAEDLDLFELDFYNDWINGTLYAFTLKYKKKRRGKEKFCEYDCDGFPITVHSNPCNSKLMLDSCVGSKGAKGEATLSIIDGFVSDNKKTLYYSPIIHSGTYKLFATDVVSLGSVYDCDWQGIPTLHEYLTATTFKIPPIITEVDADETVCGMVNIQSNTTTAGVFFSINCSGVHVDEEHCNNIRRICELGTDIPSNVPSGATDCLVSLNEIYDSSDPIDSLNSVNRYVRNVFYGLNVSGTSNTFYLPPNIDILNAGTSFNITDVGVGQLNGAAYDNFRNYYPVGAAYRQPLGNSFYFYFGILPGKTALDKLNAKYFTTCEKVISDDFIISTNVINTSAANATDGSITFSFIGGTSPYTYTWTGFNYVFGPATATTGSVITGLAVGEYTIVATDALGNIVTKTVTVGGPPALTCYVNVIQNSTTSSSNDGKVMIQSLFGGLGPYTLVHTKPDLSTNTSSVAVNDIISNVPIGLNIFAISDSSSPVQTCTTQLTVTGPTPLVLVMTGTTTSCNGDGDARITHNISGGILPYTIQTTGPYGYTGDTIIQDSLSAGTYNTIVTDSATQTATGTYTVVLGTNPVASISTTNNGNGTYTHTVTATGGVPPYNGTGVFIDSGATMTTTVIDSLGCESASVTG
jgi:hypothetical protein